LIRAFRRVMFSHWIEDAISVIENLVEKDQPVVIVGASLGAWYGGSAILFREFSTKFVLHSPKKHGDFYFNLNNLCKKFKEIFGFGAFLCRNNK
jgi:esterase/lipase